MSVLGTKLHLPSPRSRLAQRARIADQLNVGRVVADLIEPERSRNPVAGIGNHAAD
jgi:hypothetical protein